MRITILLAITFLMSASLAAAKKWEPTPTPDTGKSLARQCGFVLDVNVYHPRQIKNKFEAYDLGFCLGLVKGVYTNAVDSSFCPNRIVPIREALELITKFVAVHPDLQEEDPADIVRWALSEEFPCPDKNRANESDAPGGNF